MLIQYIPPTIWKEWEQATPTDRPLHGKVAMCEGSLAVAGYKGCMHVLSADLSRWDTFTREFGDIRTVIPHCGGCLLRVYDKQKQQFSVERFRQSGDKWQSLTLFPRELSLYGVAVTVHDHWLYAIGGMTEKGERVSTARVCDLGTGNWLEIDDLHIRRSGPSCVAVNDTIYVGGGDTDGVQVCNTVEALQVGHRHWTLLSSTTSYDCTLATVSTRLVATGGVNAQTWNNPGTRAVELYDDRVRNWIPLPPMIHKRYGHGACATGKELIVAGGCAAGATCIESMRI